MQVTIGAPYATYKTLTRRAPTPTAPMAFASPLTNRSMTVYARTAQLALTAPERRHHAPIRLASTTAYVSMKKTASGSRAPAIRVIRVDFANGNRLLVVRALVETTAPASSNPGAIAASFAIVRRVSSVAPAKLKIS